MINSAFVGTDCLSDVHVVHTQEERWHNITINVQAIYLSIYHTQYASVWLEVSKNTSYLTGCVQQKLHSIEWFCV